MRELLYQERSVHHLDFSPMKGILCVPLYFFIMEGGYGGGVLPDVRLSSKYGKTVVIAFSCRARFSKNYDKRGVVGKSSIASYSYCEALDERVYLVYEKSRTSPG